MGLSELLKRVIQNSNNLFVNSLCAFVDVGCGTPKKIFTAYRFSFRNFGI